MKVLIIGGTGNISWHVTTQAMIAGHDVFILNRNETSINRRQLPTRSTRRIIVSDINKLKYPPTKKFDVIVDFLCYTPEQAEHRIELFTGMCHQYIFISSTAVYKKPAGKSPYTEKSPAGNQFWKYAQDKLAAEKVFLKAKDFPVTIVRPAHTYDTIIPYAVGRNDWTVAQRMIDGKTIPIHGDGTVLWTLTHSEDFARALVGLFGNPKTIGEIYHITSDEWLIWNSIMVYISVLLTGKQPNVRFIPSAVIYGDDPYYGAGIIGHKMWCDIYDNSKIKAVVPDWKAEISFKEGIKRTIDWFMEDKKRQIINKEFDLFLDRLCV